MSETTGKPDKQPEPVKLVKVKELKPKGYDGTCLRPLGLCDLGGCCDTCWYGSARKSSK
jgi:hypothetical protein